MARNPSPVETAPPRQGPALPLPPQSGGIPRRPRTTSLPTASFAALEKKPRGPTEESRPKQNLLVYPRTPPHRQVDAILPAASSTLERASELIDAKGSSPIMSGEPPFFSHISTSHNADQLRTSLPS